MIKSIHLACLMSLLLAACLTGCNGCDRKESWTRYIFLMSNNVKLSGNAPWPMWQHDPRHTGRSPCAGPVNPSAPAGIDLCCFGIFGSPVIDPNANAYIGSIRSGELTDVCDALSNPADGSSGLLHGSDTGGFSLPGFPFDSQRGSVLATAIECAPLLLDDGSMLFGKDDGYMYRVSASGGLIWESPSDDPFNPAAPADDNEQMIPSPLLGADNTAVFLSHFADVYGPGPVADAAASCPDPVSYFKTTATRWYSKLYALDARTGARRWVFDPETDPATSGKMVGWSSPALGADGSYIICIMSTELSGDHYVPTTGRVFAIGHDGTRRWVYPAQGDPQLDYSLWTSPVISPAGVIYIGASDYLYDGPAKMISLTSGGELRWEFPVDENTIASSPALLPDGTLIVATQNRNLTLPSNPAEKYGKIYALTDNGTAAAEQWRYPAAGAVPWGFFSSPLVDASGNVYAASEPFTFGGGETGVLIGLESDGDLMFSIVLAGVVHGNLALGADGALYVPLRRPPRLLMFRDPAP